MDRFEFTLAGDVHFEDDGRRLVIRSAISDFADWMGGLRGPDEQALVG